MIPTITAVSCCLLPALEDMLVFGVAGMHGAVRALEARLDQLMAGIRGAVQHGIARHLAFRENGAN
eukprot:1137225-Pelagomonas_calceolata.AAC.11